MNGENVLLCISYEGTSFCGYQRQTHGRTVQQVLEAALEKILSTSISSTVSGRTDSGVHAERQYINFRRGNNAPHIPTERLVAILNADLPDDIRVFWSRRVNDVFHARYDAIKRAYYYQCYEGDVVPATLRKYYLQIRRGLDWEAIGNDLQCFVGTHDFRSLASYNGQISNYVRTITKAEIRGEGNIKKIYFEANAFLWKMIRTIVGTVLSRAEHRFLQKNQGESLLPISEILEGRDRNLAGKTVASLGLFLYDVEYKREYGIETRIAE